LALRPRSYTRAVIWCSAQVASALAPCFVFWWLLLVVVQQAQRVFLVMAAARREMPSAGVLGLTLFTGFRADLMSASVGMLAALAAGLSFTRPCALRERRWSRRVFPRPRGFAGAVLAATYIAILTVDMGYYLYSSNRLDAVFMEYIADMVGQGRHGQLGGSQDATQTAAELGEGGTWALRVDGDATPLAGAGAGLPMPMPRVGAPPLLR